MEVKILEQNGEKIVFIEGRVDTVTVPDLEMKVSPIWDTPAITLVFDCEKMEYISSSGLRIILTAHKKGQCPKYCVNEKTGFRYYLLYLDSVFKYKNKLVHNQAPIMNWLCPFLLNFHQR